MFYKQNCLSHLLPMTGVILSLNNFFPLSEKEKNVYIFFYTSFLWWLEEGRISFIHEETYSYLQKDNAANWFFYAVDAVFLCYSMF